MGKEERIADLMDVHYHVAMRHGTDGPIRMCGSCGGDLAADQHIRAFENKQGARVRIIREIMAEAE